MMVNHIKNLTESMSEYTNIQILNENFTALNQKRGWMPHCLTAFSGEIRSAAQNFFNFKCGLLGSIENMPHVRVLGDEDGYCRTSGGIHHHCAFFPFH
jgi:hypothetical protein